MESLQVGWRRRTHDLPAVAVPQLLQRSFEALYIAVA